MATYGEYVTSPQPDFGVASSGQERVSVFNASGSDLWLYRFRIRMGKRSAQVTPTVRVQATRVDSNGNPTTRAGYSFAISPGTAMETWDGGAFYEANVENAGDSPGTGAILLRQGQRLALGPLTTGAGLGFGMIQAGNPGNDQANKYLYSKTGIAQPGASTMGGSSASYEGTITVAMIGDINSAPAAPSSMSPSGSVTSQPSTYTATFNDADKDQGDRCQVMRIELYRSSDNVRIWATDYRPSTSGASDHIIDVPYGGPTLTVGSSYYWRSQMADMVGVFGSWSANFTFTIASTGSVSTSTGTPTGKQETDTPGPYTGVWSHANGLSTNAARVRIKDGSTGTILSTSALIATSVASGGTISLSWAQTGFSPLSRGRSYTYELQGRDTNNIESAWSAGREFSVNAPPSTPANLAPSGGVKTGSLPLLSFDMSDADDTPATGLVGTIRIKSTPQLDNPSFSVDTATWSLFSITTGITHTFDRDTTIFDSSPGSGRIAVTGNTAAAGAFVNVASSEFVPVIPGGAYTITARTRTTNVGLVPGLRLVWYDAAKAQLPGVILGDRTPAVNEWESISLGGAVAPSGAAFVRFVFRVVAQTAGAIGTTWFDNLDFSGLSFRSQRNANYNSTTGRWEYQTVADDLHEYNDYRWYAFGYDGTFLGGISSDAAFVYAQGLVFTITSPANNTNVADNTPTVTWSITAGGTQDQWAINFFRITGGVNTFIWNASGTGTTTSYTPPLGRLHHGETYRVAIQLRNTLGIYSDQSSTFTVLYTQPPMLANVEVSPHFMTPGPKAAAIQLSWDASAEVGFRSYNIYRWTTAEDIADRELVRKITSKSATAAVDRQPRSGVSYIYGVTQAIEVDGDLVESAMAMGEVSINFDSMILQLVSDPSVAVEFPYYSDRTQSPQRRQSRYEPWGREFPVFEQGIFRAERWEVEVPLINDDYQSADDRRQQLIDLWQKSGTMLMRTGVGDRQYVVFTGDTMPINHVPGKDRFEARFSLEQVAPDPERD